ncbi:ribosome-associated translation inhibitor RaiA [Antarcticibacterium flavum]|uniref:Ribosome-associated translation inhibitor RaiA n=1 Tax=Antarcticibacterium flavum TaxID=2058175 RepID=A0A5B7X5L3_9FLAO|nr:MULTISPECIES: ribosome-associated translation inhibitor RaiA [Antarcticibacterium]MCM4161565.1 ribosome-associated translation inhibitor RaiA [Antarcticibacterium sp. W02-3]QCY70002.1 ribosome-associated translation inhibitor RaiA [Antarcticibacterium flavum]
MTINIQFVKMPTSETMSQFVSQKLEKLADKYEWIINADVYFKLENDPAGNGKICEIELSMPGPRIFASSREENFELAAKKTTFELDKQLQKRKAVMMAH